MYIDFNTPMEDIEALRAEMEAFICHEDNKREFQPGVVVRVVGVGSMDKLQRKFPLASEKFTIKPLRGL